VGYANGRPDSLGRNGGILNGHTPATPDDSKPAYAAAATSHLLEQAQDDRPSTTKGTVLRWVWPVVLVVAIILLVLLSELVGQVPAGMAMRGM
jgi:hypothetical protein